VLRCALSAIDNASAIAPGPAPAAAASSPHFAGTVAGLGAADTGRRRLSEAEIEDIVRAEIAGRQAAARTYDQTGHRDQAARLRREADLLRPFTGAGESSRAEAGPDAASGERPAGHPA
jgi:uncharacterized protein